MPQEYILIRDVTRKECPWLERNFIKGEIVYECLKHTYGCVTDKGIACTESSSGDYPFFELPKNSIKIKI